MSEMDQQTVNVEFDLRIEQMERFFHKLNDRVRKIEQYIGMPEGWIPESGSKYIKKCLDSKKRFENIDKILQKEIED